MSNTTITSKEKVYLRKAGKMYVSIAKAMGTFFILALILTGITIIQADPYYNSIQLDSNETQNLNTFYGEAGERYQVAFGIEKENHEAYQYPQLEGANTWFKFFDYMNEMEWKVQVTVERSDSLAFVETTKIADFSGEINMVNLKLPQDGFYRITITNLSDNVLDVSIGTATVNVAILAVAVSLWIAFSVTVSIFVFMVHLGFWTIVVYALYRLAKEVNEDQKRREQMTIISPPGYNNQAYNDSS